MKCTKYTKYTELVIERQNTLTLVDRLMASSRELLDGVQTLNQQIAQLSNDN